MNGWMQIVCHIKSSVKVWHDMKNWPILGPCILGFDKLIVYFIHNIGGMGCITISTIIFMICVMCD
jgi:hypothetical protein